MFIIISLTVFGTRLCYVLRLLIVTGMEPIETRASFNLLFA